MELFLEDIDVSAAGRRLRAHSDPGGEECQPLRSIRRRHRHDAQRRDEAAPDPAQPPQQRLQVHRAGPVALTAGAQADGRMARFAVADTGIGMTPEQLGRAVSGIHPSRCLDHAQIRRYRPWPCHHAALLPDDGRPITVASEPGGAQLHRELARAQRGSRRPMRRSRRATRPASRQTRQCRAARHRRRSHGARPDAPRPEGFRYG